jgi:hypothetical protein
MGDQMNRLLAFASEPIMKEGPKILTCGFSIPQELLGLLTARNGFYAFSDALHVFHAGSVPDSLDLESWNNPKLWRYNYGSLADGHLFFAEDVFGGQFSLHGPDIVYFEAETAEIERLGSSIEQWIQLILDESKVRTGESLAIEWAEKFGPIPRGMRLVPKMPFVLGGEYTLDNLSLQDSVQAMRFRGHLARQLLDKPDKSKLRIRFTD